MIKKSYGMNKEMKSKKQSSVVTNYLYNLSYNVLSIIVPIITTPYISRVLGSEQIGRYSYSLSIVTFFSMFGVLGLNMYGQLRISRCKKDDKEMQKTFSGLFVTRVFTFSLVLIFYAIFILQQDKNVDIFITLIVLLLSNAIDISWFFQGIEEFKQITIRNFIVRIISVILMLFLVKKDTQICLYALIVQGALLVGNILLWVRFFAEYKFVKPQKKDILYNIRRTFVYFIPTIATTTHTVLDKSMIGIILSSNYQNGLYEQAYKIENTLILIVVSLSNVLLPRMSSLYHEKDMTSYNSYLRKALSFTSAVSFPIVIGLFFVADRFTVLFLGNEFFASIPIVKIFCFLILIQSFDVLIGNQCLVVRGKQFEYNLGVIVGALVNLFLNMLLIPRYFALGAAIASVLSEFAILVIFVIKAKDVIFVKIIFSSSYRYLVYSLIMGFLVSIIPNVFKSDFITLVFQIVLSLIVYFGLLFFRKDFVVISLFEKILSFIRSRTDD